jgi:hypothetical protein
MSIRLMFKEVEGGGYLSRSVILRYIFRGVKYLTKHKGDYVCMYVCTAVIRTTFDIKRFKYYMGKKNVYLYLGSGVLLYCWREIFLYFPKLD